MKGVSLLEILLLYVAHSAGGVERLKNFLLSEARSDECFRAHLLTRAANQ